MNSSNNLLVNKSNPFIGTIIIPGDKSISHRSVILGSLSNGQVSVKNFLNSEDCLCTVSAMRQLGAKIVIDNTSLTIDGLGLTGLKNPANVIDAGNSGTLIRLLTGVLAIQNFNSEITGDSSLKERPMKRIIDPLHTCGANILSDNYKAPLKINGNVNLKPINYKQQIASAQIKSCLMLASLFIDGTSYFHESVTTRDHTENMLEHFNYKITRSENESTIVGRQTLTANDVVIGSDISSAAFFIVAALISKGSKITLPNININKYRIGIIHALKIMGANIKIYNKRTESNELVGDLDVTSSKLKSITLDGNIISTLIDELPILFIACSVASGVSKISGIEELRHKESDRIKSMEEGLKAVGIKVSSTNDSIEIEGSEIFGGKINSFGDHRIAMSFAVAGLISKKSITITNTKNICTSFPTFVDIMREQGAYVYEI
jgi:3-phosphoshikimate 1-carboxyvinyltransferase